MDQRTCESCSVVFMPAHRGRRNCFECSPYRVREYTPKPRKLVPFECVECGAAGMARGATRLFCDETCRRVAELKRYGRPCSICGELRHAVSSSQRDLGDANFICHPCRRQGHGYGGYARGCRCDVCNAANNAHGREYRARRRESGDPIRRKTPSVNPLVSKTCDHCGELFEVRDGRTRFCGRECFALASIARADAAREAARALLPRGLVHVGPVVRLPRSTVAPVTVVRRTENWAGFIYGPCAWCGVAFMAATATFKDKYCSKRCGVRSSTVANRRKRGQFWITDRKRLAIYERDGWTCQLCFSPIDRDAHYQEDWAPSLDHIEPQSAALIPDHSAKNLRAAHRWCNAVRGDGTYHADLFEGVA